jgi:hypothetical protein
MQIRKMTLMLAALGAMSMVLTGCPDEGRTTLVCNDTAECDEGEICHPDAKVCVQTCTAAADCPTSAKKCEAISTTNTQQICKCTTTSFCSQDERVDGATLVCLTASEGFTPPLSTYEVCVSKCTTTDECATGQTCDTTAGVCKATTTTPSTCTSNTECTGGQVCDPTTRTCKAPAACTIGSCAAGQVCNTTTGACGAGPACTGTGQGSCSYGQFCSAGTCQDAPVASTVATECENFSHNNRPAWSGTSNGPVIYSSEFVSYQTNYQYCASQTPDAFLVRLRAYRPDANWPGTRGGLPGFFYVNTEGAQTDITNAPLLIPGTGYEPQPNSTNPGRNAEFNIYLCRPTGSRTILAGFYFTGGNPVCARFTRP